MKFESTMDNGKVPKDEVNLTEIKVEVHLIKTEPENYQESVLGNNVQERGFKGLLSLRTLYLDSNRVSLSRSNMFAYLPSLRYLSIEDKMNSIKHCLLS